MQQSRSDWVDVAKAIGIFLVVLAHTYRGVLDSGAHFPRFMATIDSVIYTFHMPLFFFISGIFFVKSIEKRSLAQFVISKVDTVAYPYLIWGTLQGLLIAFLSAKGIANQAITYREVLMFWKPLGQFWFLHDLFYIMCFSALIYKISKLKYLEITIFVAFILYVFQSYLHPIYFLSSLAKNWVFFLLGIYFIQSKLKTWVLENGIHIAYWLLLAFSLQYLFHVTLGFSYETKGILSLALAILMTMLTLRISYGIQGIAPKSLLIVGRHSMAIYLLHVFFASGIRILNHKILHIYNPYFDLLLGTVMGLFIPILVALFIEYYRIPFVFSYKR